MFIIGSACWCNCCLLKILAKMTLIAGCLSLNIIVKVMTSLTNSLEFKDGPDYSIHARNIYLLTFSWKKQSNDLHVNYPNLASVHAGYDSIMVNSNLVTTRDVSSAPRHSSTGTYTSKDITEKQQVCILVCVKSEWLPVYLGDNNVDEEYLTKLRSYLDIIQIEVDNLEEILKTCHDDEKAACMKERLKAAGQGKRKHRYWRYTIIISLISIVIVGGVLVGLTYRQIPTE
ncbi:hypothetical protein RF11_10514 [Thelohanellus kitauei]|uniref:Uncharacterized protein n=1 Tax=Thelohanellus kitauei TaxID=669202 RepID=A0A0C2M0X3_THEKT|nr:hypothetical protein RF11_10514 [Thelohanellus kitauei]